jgi:two-component system sensor histidine kinase/response regulator
MNLLSNAVKFTQQGKITLQVSSQQSSIAPEAPIPHALPLSLHFEVADTGQGIASEEIGTLFQPFVQTASSTQAKEGTGLGLAISRQFIRLMGGEIDVSSQLKQGSRFWFSISVQIASASQVSLPLPQGKVLHLAPNQPIYRILVVDDRPENRDLIAQLLNRVGFQTNSANNGQEAIEQWQRWQPHLIWMDMRMPVMDGYEATRRIRAAETEANLHQQCKIIALTASAFDEQQSSILAAGCDDLVCKPFRESTIFDKLTTHLGVEFLYAEPAEPPRSPASFSTASPNSPETSFIFHPLSLTSLPSAWVADLHLAALAVDNDRIFQLIDQLPESHQALAQKLTELVQQFDFDAILELAQENQESGE